MGTRTYRRDKNGRFAGANGGTMVTTGRAGGFANSAFRSRVAAGRGSDASKARPKPSLNQRIGTANAQRATGNRARISKDVKIGLAVTTASVGLAAYGASRGNIGALAGGMVGARVGGHFIGSAVGGSIIRASNSRSAATRKARATARPKISAGTRVKR